MLKSWQIQTPGWGVGSVSQTWRPLQLLEARCAVVAGDTEDAMIYFTHPNSLDCLRLLLVLLCFCAPPSVWSSQQKDDVATAGGSAGDSSVEHDSAVLVLGSGGLIGSELVKVWLRTGCVGAQSVKIVHLSSG